MELYLKIKSKEGMKFMVRDRITRNLNYKKPYFLYPSKCEKDIPEDDAVYLLEQNPNLVSNDKYDPKKDPQLEIKRLATEKAELVDKETKAETLGEREKANLRFQRRNRVAPPESNMSKLRDDENIISSDVIKHKAGEDAMQYLHKLQDLAVLGSKLKLEQMSDLRKHLVDLGGKPKGVKKDEVFQQLSDRINELTEYIEIYMKENK